MQRYLLSVMQYLVIIGQDSGLKSNNDIREKQDIKYFIKNIFTPVSHSKVIIRKSYFKWG
jgi:hypothetical protein